MASVRLEGVTKTYPNGHVAAKGLDLEIRDGEFMVLVGPSGCGKSTALRMIAGLETPTGGRIFIGDRDVTTVPPQDRDIAMVFQTYALYPHMTVGENLALRSPNAGHAERRHRSPSQGGRPGLGTGSGADSPPGAALRRPAPAGRAGACHRPGAQGVPL